jgi:hypothetical protein
MHPWKPVFILYNLNEFNKYAEMLCSITLKIPVLAVDIFF